MDKENKEQDMSQILGGTLNIFGLKIDLGKLLSSSEGMGEQLGELRERLKKAGAKETLSDEEWRSGQISISGHLKTRGILGEREYHIGTAGPPARREGRGKAPRPPEAVEPPVDVFQEADGIIVVAEVPGVELSDLELTIQDSILSLATKSTARRSYRKKITLGSPVEAGSLKASCRNGILEIRLKKSGA